MRSSINSEIVWEPQLKEANQAALPKPWILSFNKASSYDESHDDWLPKLTQGLPIGGQGLCLVSPFLIAAKWRYQCTDNDIGAHNEALFFTE